MSEAGTLVDARFDGAIDRILVEPDLRWCDVADDLALDMRGKRGWTPLMAACRTRNLALVSAMLDAGADPNAVNATGTTPLMFAKTVAFAAGSTDIMDALVGAGADVSARDRHGLTALDYTQKRGAMVADYLMQKEKR